MRQHKTIHEIRPVDIVSCRLPTEWGEFRLSALTDPQTGDEHIALTMGIVDDGKPVLARVHSECLTGDGFYSLRCDCGAQLQAAMKAIATDGRGVIIYLRQEGRGIGLINKIRAYALQEKGADTVEANRLLGFAEDMRDYAGAKMLLTAFGISAIHLMTNNPRKIEALQSLGLDVISRIPLHVGQNPHNARYLKTKAEKMGHIPSKQCSMTRINANPAHPAYGIKPQSSHVKTCLDALVSNLGKLLSPKTWKPFSPHKF